MKLDREKMWTSKGKTNRGKEKHTNGKTERYRMEGGKRKTTKKKLSERCEVEG